jgi:hypothetical protein
MPQTVIGYPNAGGPGQVLSVDWATGRLYLEREDGVVADCLLLSAEPVWDDLRFPASGINPVGVASDPSVDTDLAKFPGTLLFSGTQVNIIAGTAQMPHAWADGTDIRPHVHWMKSVDGGAAGDVHWQFRWRKLLPGQLATAWTDWIDGIAAGVNGTSDAADTHYIHHFGLQDMTGLHDSAQLAWQVQRVGNTDAYASDVRLMEFDIHYQINRLGSETETPEAD